MPKKYHISSAPLRKLARARVPEVRLIKVPRVRQHTNYACGTACVQSLLGYAGYDVRQDKLIEVLMATPEEGTNRLRMIELLNSFEGICAVWRGEMTPEELRATLCAGKPVVCCIQAWHDEKVYGYDYSNEWEDGHYAVAIGADRENVYFMDPSTCGNYTFITWEHFLNRWHDVDGDGLHRRAGIVVSVERPCFDPDQIVSMN